MTNYWQERAALHVAMVNLFICPVYHQGSRSEHVQIIGPAEDTALNDELLGGLLCMRCCEWSELRFQRSHKVSKFS